MKHSLIYTALLSGMLVLTGCNDSDSDDSHGKNTKPDAEQPSKPLTEEQKEKILDIVEEASPITLKESMLSGVVDTLVWGADEVDGGEECSTGSYTKSGNVVTFENCTGLFKTAIDFEVGKGYQYADLKANGKIKIADDIYEYQGFDLLNSETGESKIVNGKLKLTGTDNSGNSGTVSVVEELKVKATEKVDEDFIDVTYVLTDYTVTSTIIGQEDTVNVVGTLAVTGSTVGDYKVKFETKEVLKSKVDPDKDEATIGYPYVGKIQIDDLVNKSTTVLTASAGDTVNYTITANKEEVDKGTVKWSEVLGFK